MNSLSVTELVKGVQYRIYSDGGCKEMETTVFRTFFGVDHNGNASFYDDTMKCSVIYDNAWKFYKV
jgi:hypothetical protein